MTLKTDNPITRPDHEAIAANPPPAPHNDPAAGLFLTMDDMRAKDGDSVRERIRQAAAGIGGGLLLFLVLISMIMFIE